MDLTVCPKWVSCPLRSNTLLSNSPWITLEFKAGCQLWTGIRHLPFTDRVPVQSPGGASYALISLNKYKFWQVQKSNWTKRCTEESWWTESVGWVTGRFLETAPPIYAGMWCNFGPSNFMMVWWRRLSSALTPVFVFCLFFSVEIRGTAFRKTWVIYCHCGECSIFHFYE